MMNLGWSWQNATERLSRLSGNGANATVLGIAAKHRRQTTLTPTQEVVAVALRKTLLWSLDGLLAVGWQFLNPTMSRSGLGRFLRRHGLGGFRDLRAKNDTPQHGGLKTSEPKYIRIDVQDQRRFIMRQNGRWYIWCHCRLAITSNKHWCRPSEYLPKHRSC